jgi:hypothetical protein
MDPRQPESEPVTEASVASATNSNAISAELTTEKWLKIGIAALRLCTRNVRMTHSSACFGGRAVASLSP